MGGSFRRGALLFSAVVLMAVVPGLSLSAVERESPPPAKDRGADVKDTHDRLKRIYARLKIKRVEVEPKANDNQGCSCQRQQREGEPSKRSSRRWRAPSLPPMLGYLLIAVVVIAMLVPLVLALRSGYHAAPSEQAAESPDEGEQLEAELCGPWEVSLEHCRRLLHEGKLVEAFGALHRVTLVALERQGHLSLDTTTTNWQYVTRLLSKPPLRELLAEVTIAAERSVLGHKPPPSSRFDELEGLLRDRLLDARGRA